MMQSQRKLSDITVAGPSPLAEKIRRRIRRDGFISVSEYMRMALTDPEYGYYTGRDPLGAKGDFITAPEISQLFGELIGIWCICAWQALERPSKITLIELGPGRGTLMHDVLRVLKRLATPMFDGLEVIMVEVSPTLRAKQEAALALSGAKVSWHENLDQLPQTPWLLIGNEFLDALPITQALRTENGWCERVIKLDEKENFIFAEGAALTLDNAPEIAEPGDIFEYCPTAHHWMKKLGTAMAQSSGAALFVDYGYINQEWGDSLQAVKAHHAHPVLEMPGEADVTAHVDFARLAQTALESGAEILGPVTQATFLQNLGISLRAEHLTENATEAQKLTLLDGVRRLIAPEEMGRLFKVIALTSPGLPSIPGFE